MSRKVRLAVAVGIAALTFSLGSAVMASIVASDSFSYTLGGLNGNNGGLGWSGAWTAVAAATVVDPPVDLAAGYLNGGNRALQFTTPNSDNAAYRSLGSAFSGSEVYVSFLFRFDAGLVGDNDFMGFWMDNVTTGSHTNVPNIGLKGQEGGGGTKDYFVRITGAGGAYSDHQAAVDETVQIVGRLFKDASSNFNKFQLWVNPDLGDLGSPDVTFSNAGSLSSFGVVGFRTANLDSNDQLVVDELRFGTKWTDVVVPEPCSLLVWGLLACGSLAVALRRVGRVR